MEEVKQPDVTGKVPEVVTTTDEKQQNTSSANSSTADEASSIEALNWSDLEDDEPSAGIDAALLQSIHSQLDDDGGENELKEESTSSATSDEQTIMEDSRGALETEVNNKDDLVLEYEKDLKIGRQGMKRKREESPMMSSTLSATSATTEPTGDLSSNAAVLDDGPIWAKGSKRYKFEENRLVNQKLTFGVLLSVVLAMGLGLGNLVAYNECESEHKAPEVPASLPKLPVVSPPSVPTEEMIQAISSTPFPTVPSPVQVIPSAGVHIPPPKEVPELIKSSRPMVDPKYSQHAEELAKVLRKLDELSRKIDRFENTTRQLGGIVMMKDELRPREPPSKKTKFLKLLSELIQTKKIKKMENNGGAAAGGEGKTWRDKKEEVLDEIAGVVLEAMQDEDFDLDNIVEEEEILLEESRVFPVDGEEEKLPDLQEESQPPTVQAQNPTIPTDGPPEELIAELPDEISEGFIISPAKPNVKESQAEHLTRQKEKKDGSHAKKLKREFAVDMDDMELEMNSKKVRKHSREEFQTEKTQNQEEFQKQKKELREELQKEKKQKHEAFQRQKKDNREAFQKQKHGKEEFEKRKKRDAKEFQKHGSTEAKQGRSSEVKSKKEKQEFYPDWSNLRAKNREAHRRTGEGKAKESKVNNWQAERSKIREQFRGIRPT